MLFLVYLLEYRSLVRSGEVNNWEKFLFAGVQFNFANQVISNSGDLGRVSWSQDLFT